MMLELYNLSGAYTKGHWIVNDISLKLQSGERIAILGRNGAGKSTFIKAIMSLLPVKKGKVLIDGFDISGVQVSDLINKGIGYFPQGGVVFPHLSIDENMKIARGKREIRDRENINDRIRGSLPVFHTRHGAVTKAGDLSGGERTQLALAMVLINNPGLLLLDEPFAGISPNIIRMISDILIQFYNDNPYTMILIGQNEKLAASLTDRSFILRNGGLDSI
jgi:branched-chain amino acid transport system ATP-binding protein